MSIKMTSLIYVVFLLLQSILAINFEHHKPVKKDNPQEKPTPTEKIEGSFVNVNLDTKIANSSSIQLGKIPIPNNDSFRNSEIESGALMRGVYIFVGCSIIFFIYVAVKTYRNRRKTNVVVRKYGVRTRRSDVEMEPLPLDDEDEDDTVFDVGNIRH